VVREVVNGVMYVLSTGCQRSAVPKDLPPRSTVNDYFRRWDCDGALEGVHYALHVACREEAGQKLAGRLAAPGPRDRRQDDAESWCAGFGRGTAGRAARGDPASGLG
jgi:transposase